MAGAVTSGDSLLAKLAAWREKAQAERAADGQRLLDAALRYAALGLRVFPLHHVFTKADGAVWCSCGMKAGKGEGECSRAGKHPHTKNGLKNGTTDEATIRGWWRQWPQANVGLCTGGAGRLVVDVDPKHGGDESLDKLLSTHGTLATGPVAYTGEHNGKRGMHIHLTVPDDVCKSSQGDEDPGPLHGIDTRGQGGYVVAPPSIHVSGVRYEWATDHTPWDLVPPPPPEWLVDLLRKRQAPTPSAPRPVAPPRASPGRRGLSGRRGWGAVTMAPRFSTATLDAIKARVDLADEVRRHGVELKASGLELVGLCPFHADTSPSFAVTPAKGLWVCHGCGKGGDVFSFLCRMDGLRFPDAVQELARSAGVRLEEPETPQDGQSPAPLGESTPATQPHPREAAKPSRWRPTVAEPVDEWATRYTPGDAAETWERLTTDSPCLTLAACLAVDPCVDCAAHAARAWLVRERGLPANARLDAGAATATVDNLEDWPAHARGWVGKQLRDRGPALVAPLRSARTNVVEGLALRFLEPKGDGPKCLTVAGLPHRDADGAPRGYGAAGAALRADLVVLVEGLTDTLTAGELLWPRHDAIAVGAIAVGSLKHWADWLGQRRHGRVVLVPDLDRGQDKDAPPTAEGTGQAAAMAAKSHLRDSGVETDVFRWGAYLKRLSASLADPLRVMHVKDLTDSARLGVPWPVLRQCFAEVLEVDK